MSINFIPNDPFAGSTAPEKRVQTKRKNRPATRADFTFSNASADGTFGRSLHQEAAYAASKGAVRIFTKVTAGQRAVDKIRCNSVHPGPIDTEMLHSAMKDRTALERRLRRVPLGRMGTVNEVVTAVLYLASDDSSYVTGSELVVDGGALAQ